MTMETILKAAKERVAETETRVEHRLGEKTLVCIAPMVPTSFGLLSLARVHPRLRPSPRCFGLARFTSTTASHMRDRPPMPARMASAWGVWTPMPSDLTPPVIYRQTQRGQKDPKTLRYVPFFLEEIQSLPPAPTALRLSPPPGSLYTPLPPRNHDTPVPGTFKLWLGSCIWRRPLVLSWVTAPRISGQQTWVAVADEGSAWAMSALLYTSRLSSDLLQVPAASLVKVSRRNSMPPGRSDRSLVRSPLSMSCPGQIQVSASLHLPRPQALSVIFPP